MKKKKFFSLVPTPFIMWLLQNIASGVVSGVAVFITKDKLEKIFKRKKNEE
jgi:hypothetical protein